MKCNIVELGGTKNGFFTRNHFIDISQIKNNLKLFANNNINELKNIIKKNNMQNKIH